jgi:PRC-barrel domain
MFNRMRTNPRISARVDSTTNVCLLGTTSLIEDDVYDAAGKFLGEIDEIVLDVHTGCVRYAVLALGGFLGIGRKRFAVPWSAFTPDADYRRCIVDVALMQLMALPVPQDDPWLRRGDITWGKENAYLLRQQALLGVIPPQHRSTFLELGRPKRKRQPD